MKGLCLLGEHTYHILFIFFFQSFLLFNAFSYDTFFIDHRMFYKQDAVAWYNLSMAFVYSVVDFLISFHLLSSKTGLLLNLSFIRVRLFSNINSRWLTHLHHVLFVILLFSSQLSVLYSKLWLCCFLFPLLFCVVLFLSKNYLNPKA